MLKCPEVGNYSEITTKNNYRLVRIKPEILIQLLKVKIYSIPAAFYFGHTIEYKLKQFLFLFIYFIYLFIYYFSFNFLF